MATLRVLPNSLALELLSSKDCAERWLCCLALGQDLVRALAGGRGSAIPVGLDWVLGVLSKGGMQQGSRQQLSGVVECCCSVLWYQGPGNVGWMGMFPAAELGDVCVVSN